MTDHREDTIDDLFDRGLKVRREVLGADYVDGSLKSANDFMMAFQQITTEWCWGYAWTRSGLDRKTRSLINLAMLTALNRAGRDDAFVAALTDPTRPGLAHILREGATYTWESWNARQTAG